METLVLATRNPGKIAELQEMLAPLNITVKSALDLNLPDVPEDTGTFEGNAAQKAEAASKATGLPVLADDSGLCVDALGGEPGVETAHYGGWKNLLPALKNIPESHRGAHFVCVMAYAAPGEPIKYFKGRIFGRIATEARGEGGFGFDPVFIPDGYEHTFAELGAEVKNPISHRGQALQSFVDHVMNPQKQIVRER